MRECSVVNLIGKTGALFASYLLLIHEPFNVIRLHNKEDLTVSYLLVLTSQSLLAIPLIGLYMGGAFAVKAIEGRRSSLASP
jgi:hypothetical protein